MNVHLPTDQPTYAPIHLPNHPLTHLHSTNVNSLTNTPTHPPIHHPPTHPLTYTTIHSPNYGATQLPTYTTIRSPTHSPRNFLELRTWRVTHLLGTNQLAIMTYSNFCCTKIAQNIRRFSVYFFHVHSLKLRPFILIYNKVL